MCWQSLSRRTQCRTWWLGTGDPNAAKPPQSFPNRHRSVGHHPLTRADHDSRTDTLGSPDAFWGHSQLTCHFVAPGTTVDYLYPDHGVPAGLPKSAALTTRAASTNWGANGDDHKPQREPVARVLPHASVAPESLAHIVKNDLSVLCAALEPVRDQVALPLELRALVNGALARSSDMADRIRDLQ